MRKREKGKNTMGTTGRFLETLPARLMPAAVARRRVDELIQREHAALAEYRRAKRERHAFPPAPAGDIFVVLTGEIFIVSGFIPKTLDRVLRTAARTGLCRSRNCARIRSLSWNASAVRPERRQERLRCRPNSIFPALLPPAGTGIPGEISPVPRSRAGRFFRNFHISGGDFFPVSCYSKANSMLRKEKQLLQ